MKNEEENEYEEAAYSERKTMSVKLHEDSSSMLISSTSLLVFFFIQSNVDDNVFQQQSRYQSPKHYYHCLKFLPSGLSLFSLYSVIVVLLLKKNKV